MPFWNKNNLSKERREELRSERKTNKAQKKKEFWDSILYYQKEIDISVNHDGTMVRTITKKRPLLLIVSLIVLVLIFIFCLCIADYSNALALKWDSLGMFFVRMFTPQANSLRTWDNYFSYMWGDALKDIWATNEMCFIGTIFGSLIALPIAYLCAQNINKNKYIRLPVRIFNDVLRTVPQMVMALLLRLFFGPSLVTGILSIIIFTVGIMYQLTYEYVETLELSPFEAIRSNGGDTIQCISLGLRPAVMPMFFANMLYTFEINIRASVILGYVGAGGYGYWLKQNYGAGYYDKIGAMLIPLFCEVIILQIVSNLLGRKSR